MIMMMRHLNEEEGVCVQGIDMEVMLHETVNEA